METNSLEVMPVKIDNSMIMLKSSLRKRRRVLKDEMKKSLEQSATSSPFHTMLLMHTVLVSSRKEEMNRDPFADQPLKQFQKFIDDLEIFHGSEIVILVLQLLHFSQAGLSTSTITNICELKLGIKQAAGRVIAILADLQDFVSTKWVNAIPHYKIKFPTLAVEIEKYGDAAECFEHIMEVISGDKEDESEKAIEQNNAQKQYKELLYTMLQLGEVETMLLEHVFSLASLSQMLKNFDVFTLMHILELLDLTQDGDKDITCLSNILKDLAPLLMLAPDHLTGQFHVRSFHGLLKIPNNCAKMRTLVKDTKDTNLAYLLPMEKAPLELAVQNSDLSPKHLVLKLRTMKEDPYHIISITESELKVWNIYSRECVRTFQNLNETKDVLMVDDAHAVVLCGRELVVYNLDTGGMKSKLKGMLNVKMPFFGIHDHKNVMALSRNRMCANMMNTDTGDMEATFKVQT